MDAVIRFLDNRMNPLLLRELRQLVRNRFIIVLINLFIAVLVIACVMSVLFREASQIEGSGSGLFVGLTSIMSLACFLAVVVYTGMTTANERINGDLMFVSAMRPSSIVFGKAWSGAVLTVLLMSITAPFVTLAFLLRGLDIEMVAMTFFGTFIHVQVMNAVAICLFSNVKTKVQMSVMMALGFILILFLVGPTLSFLFMHSLTYGRMTAGWTGYVVYALREGAVWALFLAAAVASIAPPSSNRLLPVRLALTAIFLVSLALCTLFPSISLASDPVVVWGYAWIGAAILLTLLAVCERDTWSFRIRQTIPRFLPGRLLAFPFYTGSPNGLAWIGLLVGIVVLVLFQTGSIQAFEHAAFFFLLFAFDYCVTAMLLRSRLAPRSIPPDKTWTIVLFFLLVFTLGSMLTFFLFHQDSMMYGNFYDPYSESRLSALNPFLIHENSPATIQKTAALVWGAILVLPFLIWFVLRAVRFSPFGAADAMTPEQARAAVRQADAISTGRPESTEPADQEKNAVN